MELDINNFHFAEDQNTNKLQAPNAHNTVATQTLRPDRQRLVGSNMKDINYSKILQNKLQILLPDLDARNSIQQELARYGVEGHEREIDRVRLAILKVAGISMAQVREWVEIARRDYRDVLAAAEYPNQLTNPTWQMTPAAQHALSAADLRQYLDWLEK